MFLSLFIILLSNSYVPVSVFRWPEQFGINIQPSVLSKLIAGASFFSPTSPLHVELTLRGTVHLLRHLDTSNIIYTIVPSPRLPFIAAVPSIHFPPSACTPTLTPTDKSPATMLDFLIWAVTTLTRWFRLKVYQYEVTFALYMLTPTEKFIFSASLPLWLRNAFREAFNPPETNWLFANRNTSSQIPSSLVLCP